MISQMKPYFDTHLINKRTILVKQKLILIPV